MGRDLRGRVTGDVRQTDRPLLPGEVAVISTHQLEGRPGPVRLPEHCRIISDLVLTAVLLVGLDWGPDVRDLLEVGVRGDVEGVHAVSDDTGWEGGVIGRPLLVPLTPEGHTLLVPNTVILQVKLGARRTGVGDEGVVGLLEVRGRGQPFPGHVDWERRRRTTEDGPSTVWPGASSPDRSVVLPNTRQALHRQRGLGWRGLLVLYEGVGGTLVHDLRPEGDSPVGPVHQGEVVLGPGRTVTAGVIVRVTTVMDLTDQFGTVQGVGLPPLAPGLQVRTEAGGPQQFDPLPVVVTGVPQEGVVLELVPLLESPGDLQAVAGVGAGDGGGALWPGGGVGVVSVLPAHDVSPVRSLGPPVHITLHPVAGLARVPQGAVQPGEADGVPGEGVVMIIVGSVGDWIVTVPEDTLQLAGH